MASESIRCKMITVAVWLLLSTWAVAGRPGNFQVIGPGGGGAMFHPTVSPHNRNEVLVACDMTGSYITHDGGSSWRMFNLGDPVRFFVFDPIDPKTVYAATDALWKSSDNGESWRLVWPRPDTVQSIRMNSDHADEHIVGEPDPLGTFVALTIDPAHSDALIAATVKDGKSALFVSLNAGATWEKVTDLPERARAVWIDPGSSETVRDLYVATEHGMMVRRSSVWRNQPGPPNAPFTDVSAGFSASKDMLIYASSDAGLYVSVDRGVSWRTSPLPGKGAEVRAVATSLRHPETAYASYSNLKLDGKTWLGVARTRDGGRTWALVWREERVAAPNVQDAWITPELGVDWGENPLEMGVAEQDPNLMYATDLGRTMMTVDGGETWKGVYSKRVPGADWTSTGLDVTTNYGYFYDPFDSSRRFIAYTDIGLFRSEDRGQSWKVSSNGIPEAWRNTTYWLVFDSKARGKMWGVMSGTHDLPRPKMWRRTSPAEYKGGVSVSIDGGRTWKPSSTGMAATAPTHILLDPASAPGARVLWVAAMGRGVYKSSDDGRTWVLKNHGISQEKPLAWRLAQAPDGTLYVLIARRSEDGSIGNSGDGAIYKSRDGGENWLPVPMPSGVNAPNGLAIDPEDPDRLFLAAWARAAGMHGEGGGIFLSTNGGATWKNVLDRDRHVYDVTIDPRDSHILYASGFESSAWRSVDRGEHWTRIPGFNFKWGHRVIPDPEDPMSIYITTFGGSVWHGRVDGEDRPVDVVTTQVSPEGRNAQ